MKQKILIFFFGLFSTLFLNAQSTEWSLDNAHSSVKFSIAHMVISETTGKFQVFSGSFFADKPDFSDAKIDFSIDVNSINTDDAKRDGHLKSPDFFDVAKYPSITFKAIQLKKISDKKYQLMGNLTMHGVTKKVTFDVKYGGTITDPFKNTRAGFKISGEINRTDFGLKYNSVMDAGGLMIGENVSIEVNIELIKKK